MSADGNKIVATARPAGGPGPIYVSTDFGTTWTTNNTPYDAWRAVASSADGGKLVAASGFYNYISWGSIYTSQSIPKPLLNLLSSNDNFKLSWLVPSTNFVSQQSPDLSSWTDVTNAPTLNLTTLQNEVVLSPTNSSGFYRLKTR